MSVNTAALWAYGYKVDIIDEDFIDNICGKHGATYAPYGSTWNDRVNFIITCHDAAIYIHDYEHCSVESIPDGVLPESVEAMKNAVEEITGTRPTEDPQSYVGIYIS